MTAQIKPYLTLENNLSDQLTVNYDSTLKINLGYITSDLGLEDLISYEILINDRVQDAQSFCNQNNDCFIRFVEDSEYDKAMILALDATESAFRQYYYLITKLSGEKVEVLNLRLTIRLTSQETGVTNDYKIFVEMVKDKSIVDQKERGSDTAMVQPPKETEQ